MAGPPTCRRRNRCIPVVRSAPRGHPWGSVLPCPGFAARPPPPPVVAAAPARFSLRVWGCRQESMKTNAVVAAACTMWCVPEECSWVPPLCWRHIRVLATSVPLFTDQQSPAAEDTASRCPLGRLGLCESVGYKTFVEVLGFPATLRGDAAVASLRGAHLAPVLRAAALAEACLGPASAGLGCW